MSGTIHKIIQISQPPPLRRCEQIWVLFFFSLENNTVSVRTTASLYQYLPSVVFLTVTISNDCCKGTSSFQSGNSKNGRIKNQVFVFICCSQIIRKVYDFFFRNAKTYRHHRRSLIKVCFYANDLDHRICPLNVCTAIPMYKVSATKRHLVHKVARPGFHFPMKRKDLFLHHIGSMIITLLITCIFLSRRKRRTS